MRLLLALVVAASSAPLTRSFSMRTRYREDVKVEALLSGNLVLTVGASGAALTPEEARTLGSLLFLLGRAGDQDGHSVFPDYDALADEAAKATDAHFCAKAKTDWERKAFCRKEAAK